MPTNQGGISRSPRLKPTFHGQRRPYQESAPDGHQQERTVGAGTPTYGVTRAGRGSYSRYLARLRPRGKRRSLGITEGDRRSLAWLPHAIKIGASPRRVTPVALAAHLPGCAPRTRGDLAPGRAIKLTGGPASAGLRLAYPGEF